MRAVPWEKIQQIKEWRRAEYQKRTDAIDAGAGKIEWLDPGTRVSWSEVVAYAESIGVRLHPLDRSLI